MTGIEKRKHAEMLIEQGDIRSYNEIRADMELIIWTAQYQGKETLELLNNVYKAKEEIRTGEVT